MASANLSGGRLGVRPQVSHLFLERPRLLRLLPEESGYVVWLEAAYGSGKSVLAAQWAGRLEATGWRVIWLALAEGDPRSELASALGLPGNAAWRAVLDALNAMDTAVILEDLEGGEALTPLLKHGAGLVLLSSRRTLNNPELPRLRTEGRLMHLRADQMTFTPDEASALFGGVDSSRAWTRTGGWALPLHLAALTGEVPDDAALWQGVRESVSEAQWRALLLLSALDVFPRDSADGAVLGLAELGFVQALEGGYRLHPMAAEQFMRHRLDEVRSAVRLEAPRLEPRLHGLALERVGLMPELAELLETQPGLGATAPTETLRWHGLLPPGGLPRAFEVGAALGRLGHMREAAVQFDAIACNPFASDAERLEAFGQAAYHLAAVDFDAARAAVAAGDGLLSPQMEPERAARFLQRSAEVDYQIGTLQDGVNRLERALQLLPVGRSKQRSVLLANAAMMRWWLNGDSDMYIAARAAQLNDASDSLPPGRETDHCWNLGITALMSGALEVARGWFARGAKPDPANALYALHCEIFLAILERRYAELPGLLARLEVWNNPALDDRALSFWAFALLNDGRAAEALTRTRGRDGELLGLIRPLILHANGQHDLALQSLPEPVDAATYRETALLIQAVRYRVTRDPLELERLIGLNVERDRVLAYYVPVAELPRHRPELSRHHSLHAVLESGWKEAILLRLDELPHLHVRLLGRLEVLLQGQPVTLSARPRDALTLLALRLPRDQIAEELWRDLEPEKSRNNLHVTLNALRKLLEPWGVPTYLLESGLKRTVCDLWQLEAALDASDAAAVQRLYADLAPGVDARALDERREHLRGRAIRTVLNADGDDLETRLEWVLYHDPLHEEAMLRLLELLRRSGRRVTAQRRLREFARTLRDEIGVEPSAALQAALSLG